MPVCGRWLNRDPIVEAGGINLYAYLNSNPINSSDPLGLFDSQDEAAEAAIRKINPKSINENREYAGHICQNKFTGSFFTSDPNQGTPSSAVPSKCPWYGDDAGIYHTHAAFDPKYDNENFSPADKSLALTKPIYVGTPDGKIYKWVTLPTGGGVKILVGSGAK